MDVEDLRLAVLDRDQTPQQPGLVAESRWLTLLYRTGAAH